MSALKRPSSKRMYRQCRFGKYEETPAATPQSPSKAPRAVTRSAGARSFIYNNNKDLIITWNEDGQPISQSDDIRQCVDAFISLCRLRTFRWLNGSVIDAAIPRLCWSIHPFTIAELSANLLYRLGKEHKINWNCVFKTIVSSERLLLCEYYTICTPLVDAIKQITRHKYMYEECIRRHAQRGNVSCSIPIAYKRLRRLQFRHRKLCSQFLSVFSLDRSHPCWNPILSMY